MKTMATMVKSPKTGGACENNECMSAAEYFQAKLNCEMTPATLKGMMEKKMTAGLCLIDVRAMEKFNESRIPGAINIPLMELSVKINLLPKEKMIVAYCGDMTCTMAPKACLELARKGYKTMELSGGIKAWQEKGFPVEMKA